MPPFVETDHSPLDLQLLGKPWEITKILVASEFLLLLDLSYLSLWKSNACLCALNTRLTFFDIVMIMRWLSVDSLVFVRSTKMF